jgi:hypothetical protein
MTLGEKVLITIVIIAIILSNPPILNIVNEYCKTHPLTLGFPTLWLYLEVIWTIVIISFAIAALKIKKWGELDERVKRVILGEG